MPFKGNFHFFLFIKRAYSFHVMREQVMVKHAGLGVIRPGLKSCCFHLGTGCLEGNALTTADPPVTSCSGFAGVVLRRGAQRRAGHVQNKVCV